MRLLVYRRCRPIRPFAERPMSSKDGAPENRRTTGRDARGRFRKGVTGNAGGRPKSMAAAILARCPTASTEIVDFWLLVAFGSATAVRRRFGVKPRMQDRLAAAAELADRLHGRAVQAVEIDDDRPDVPCFIMPPGSEIAIR
jgi:hypothetical protein